MFRSFLRPNFVGGVRFQCDIRYSHKPRRRKQARLWEHLWAKSWKQFRCSVEGRVSEGREVVLKHCWPVVGNTQCFLSLRRQRFPARQVPRKGRNIMFDIENAEWAGKHLACLIGSCLLFILSGLRGGLQTPWSFALFVMCSS